MLGGRSHHAIAVRLPCQVAVLQLEHRSRSLTVEQEGRDTCTIDSEIYGHRGLAGGTSCRRSELGLGLDDKRHANSTMHLPLLLPCVVIQCGVVARWTTKWIGLRKRRTSTVCPFPSLTSGLD